jgi:class 3 adenylate cyclase
VVEARHERRLAAIVFTDIVNFSATVHRDEVLGQRLLNRQRAVIQRLTSAHGGRQIKDRKSTRLNSSHNPASRMPSSA